MVNFQLPRCAFSVLLLAVYLIQYPPHSLGQSEYTVYVDGERGVLNATCCATGFDSPCKTLEIAFMCVHQIKVTSSVSVFTEPGNYSLSSSDVTVFTGRIGGIAIRGNSTSDGSIFIQCNEDAGLTFIECENIALSNLILSGCAYLHNSTSRDFDSPGFKFLLFHTSLYFLFCVNVNLSYVTVRDSNSTGVVMYNTVGNNVIEHSEVINNQYGGPYSSGGGLYIEFSYCNPQNSTCSDDSGSNVPTKYVTGSNYDILSTLFKQNKAHVFDPELFSFILPQKSNHLPFGRGGGVSVFFKGRAANNTVMVNHCFLERNVALWGGGIFVEHQDWSNNNSFSVYDSLIEDNMCLYDTSSSAGTGGGGSRVGYIFFSDTHARNNSIHFEKCNISTNTAYFGGGISFYAARERLQRANQQILSVLSIAISTIMLQELDQLQIWLSGTLLPEELQQRHISLIVSFIKIMETTLANLVQWKELVQCT